MRIGCGCCLAALLLLPSTGSATLLSDIQTAIAADGSFIDSIGDLTFEFTEVVETSGQLDLTKIDLTLIDDGGGVLGFDLTPTMLGAIGISSGAADLKLEFTVASTLGIFGAGNAIESVVVPAASVAVSELIVEVPGVDLGVFDIGTSSKLSAFADLGGTFNALTIDSKNLTLTAPDGTADLQILRQRFAVVPEPGTAGLVMLGLVGLWRAAPRRG